MKLGPLFYKFCETTKIHGFSHIKSNTNKPFAAVWGILIISAFGFALNDFANLIRVYHSEPIAVSVLHLSNENLSIPTPTLCMEIHVNPTGANPVEANRTSFSKDGQFLSNGNSPTSSPFGMGAVDMGEIVTFNRSDPLIQDNDLREYTFSLLGYLTDNELKYTGQQYPHLSKYAKTAKKTDPSSLTLTMTDERFPEALQKLYEAYMNASVPLVTLKKMVGSRMCQLQLARFTNYEYLGDPKTVALPLCKPDMISHVSFDLVCVKLFETPTVPTQLYTNFGLENTRRSIFQGESFYDSMINFLWHLDFQGRPTIPVENHADVISWSPSKFASIDLAVDMEYQFHNGKNRKCGSRVDESQYNCFWRNRVELMSKSCGCWPSTLFHVSSRENKLPKCSENPGNLIPNVTHDTETFAQCDQTFAYLDNLSQLCPPDREVYSYSYTVEDSHVCSKIHKEIPRGTTEFRIQKGYKRIVIKEFPYKTWSNFISEFGGSIGTWLGASLMAFIHIPAFIISVLVVKPSISPHIPNSVANIEQIPTATETLDFPPLS